MRVVFARGGGSVASVVPVLLGSLVARSWGCLGAPSWWSGGGVEWEREQRQYTGQVVDGMRERLLGST
ncbi:hypothetical protein [Buchananella felis]|uniref:hypothetical protein n=1 Tax=Buchananella felis TaxID=3231492 RepID=UPI003527E2FF